MPTPTAKTLKVPGARIYYETRGSGPLLLMIPGGPIMQPHKVGTSIQLLSICFGWMAILLPTVAPAPTRAGTAKYSSGTCINAEVAVSQRLKRSGINSASSVGTGGIVVGNGSGSGQPSSEANFTNAEATTRGISS